MITNLLYRSETTLQPKDPKLKAILAQARHRNGNMDITGYLHWEDGIFHQWIEGPEAELQIVERYIYDSKSHHGLTVLGRNVVPTRQFPDWDMALGLSEENSLFNFIATHEAGTADHQEYARAVLAFMHAQSGTQVR